MLVRNTMSVCMLVFCILIFILYLIKDKTKNQSTLRFKLAQLVIIGCLLFNLFSNNIFKIYGIDSWQDELLARIYIFGFLLIFQTLEGYFLNEVFNYDIKLLNVKYNKASLGMFLNFLLCAVLIFVLPINIYWDGAYKFSFTGLASTYTMVICFVYQIFNFILTFINWKDLDKEKLVPIFLVPIFFIAALLLYNIADYSFLEMAMVASVATVYFSIAKPDQRIQVDIEQSIVQLEKASRFKSEFLSNTSHDLKTPLNAILGTVNNLLDNKNVTSNTRKNLGDILYASNVLYETISNILFISKLEQPENQFTKKVYNLKEDIYVLPCLSKIRNKKDSINFFVEIDNNVPDLIYGERELILSIIDNTLSYSNFHVSDGSIALKVGWNDETDELIIQVDNICETCGELYTNLDESVADIYECINNTDFGINLSSVLTKRLNGRIDYDFENGVHNTIIYTIPQVKNKEQYNYDNISYKGMKVLVVDDSELNLKLAERELKQLDFDVTTVNNGQDAIEKVKDTNFNVILLDINMTNMNGEETLKHFKENSDFNVPVIALTADESVNAYNKYIGVGFSDYMVKPFKKSDLISHLEEIFKGGNK